MRKLGLLLVVIVGLLIGGGASTASAGDRPPDGIVALSPSTVEVGGSFTVSLTGFLCDEQTIELRIINDQEQNVAPQPSLFPISETGSLVQALTAPSTPGTYIVVAVFDSGFCPRGQATLTVVPTDTTTTTTTTTTTIAGQVAPTTAATTTTAAPVTLPATGRSSDALVWAALAALLAGGGLVMVAARRS
jgi:LPXTG-motif cell wall-anchored protein